MRRPALIGISFFLFAGAFFAVAGTALGDTGILQLSLSPQYPKPGDVVTVTATDYAVNADSLTYLWSVDGSVVSQGVGEKTFTLTAGPAGSAHTVTLVVALGGVTEDSASATVRPADMDLILEGDTSVPPFYIGRPLPNAQSGITVLAMPHIVSGTAEVPANSLIYSWKENDVPLANLSGYGKSSIVVTPPTFSEPFTISVHAETQDGTGAADASATITPHAPVIAIYEDAPLLGVRFEKAISAAFPFSGTEVSFAAFPIFVSNPAALSYQWALDGTPFSVDPARPGAVTFRKTSSGSGSHTVSFSFTNPSAFLENATDSFTLTF